MFDPLDRLIQDDRLFRLLERYVEASEADRDAWHSRPADVPDDDNSQGEQIVAHGELLGAAWIEINLDGKQKLTDGQVTACYRATSAGRQALRQAGEIRAGMDPAEVLKPRISARSNHRAIRRKGQTAPKSPKIKDLPAALISFPR